MAFNIQSSYRTHTVVLELLFTFSYIRNQSFCENIVSTSLINQE